MRKYLDSPAAGFMTCLLFIGMILAYIWTLAQQIPEPATAWQPPGSTITASVANPDADR